MTTFLLVAAILVGAMLIVGLHRVWAGPTVFDRLVAVALVTANTLLIVVLVASVIDRIEAIIDIAIAIALLAFTLPVALGKHFETRRSADAEEQT
jgi:multicomponent Na+:H+ antiporter subunit F